MTGDVRKATGGGQLSARELRARTVGVFRFTKPGMWSEPVDAAVRDPRPVHQHALPEGFTGRGWLIEQIDSFLDDQPCGYVWIEADAGMGKTALAAHLAQERGWISHFSRYADGGSVRATLRNLSAQVITQRELWVHAPGRKLADWAGTPEGFEALLARAAGGDRLVLVVDGADGAVTPDGWQPWGLPDVLPPNVFVVGTYRTGSPPPPCDVPSVVIRIADDERNRADLRDHLRGRHAGDFGGLWVYARHVLDEIRLGRAVGPDELPGDLRSYHLGLLDRWRQDDNWHDVGLPVLSTVVVAREALPLLTLIRMSGVDEHAVQEWCDLRLRPFLVDGTVEVYDACLREAWSELLESAAVEAHSRIADHCLAHLEDDYSLRHLAPHLMAAERFADLEALLREEKDGELVWFAAHDAAGTLDEFSAAVTVVREHWERRTDEALQRGRLAPMLVRELHYQLVSTSLSSRTATVSPRLLEAAAATGVWSPERVLAQLRRIPDPDDQIAAVALVVPHLPEAQRRDVVARVLAFVDDWSQTARWQAIGALAPQLSEEQLNRYFRLVLSNCGADFAITAFGRIVPHLTQAGIDRALWVAEWLSVKSGDHRPLIALAPHLSGSQLDTALQVAASIADAAVRFEVLAGLIPRLPEERRADVVTSALEALDAVSPQTLLDKVRRMLVLAPHAPGDRIDELSTMVGHVSADEDRAPLMVEMSRYLPAERRRAVIAQVHKWAMGARHTKEQAALLVTLAEHLDPDQLSELLDAVARLPHESARADVLGELAPGLGSDHLTQAVRIAEAIVDGTYRGQALAALAVNHPEGASVAAAAIAATTGITGRYTLARTKGALAAQLPAPDRNAVLDDVLTAFEESGNEHLVQPVLRLLTDDQFARLHAIGGTYAMEYVATHGPADLLTRVLDKLATWGGISFAQAAEKSAKHLPPAEAHRLAVVAASFDDAEGRGRSLCALLPYLPPDERQAVATTALAALTEKPEFYLAKLLPQLSVDQLEEVLTLALGLVAKGSGAQLLRGLALTLPADRLPEIRAIAGTLTSEPDRGSVLNAVLSRLPSDEQARLCEEEVEAATTHKYPYTILMWLADYLPHHLHAKALGIVRALGPVSDAGTGVLRDLAPHLSLVDMEEAVALARTATHDRTRVRGLAHLLPHLREQHRAEVFEEVLGCDLPLDLVPHLTANELARAFDAIYLGQDTVFKALLARAAELGDHLLYLRILRRVWRTNDRDDSLSVLNYCCPVLGELAGVDFGPQVLTSLDDVHRWWP